MKQSTYLYGRQFNAEEIKVMPYVEALQYKVQCAKGLISGLCEASVTHTDWRRISQVHKAIDFNNALIAEAHGKELDAQV